MPKPQRLPAELGEKLKGVQLKNVGVQLLVEGTQAGSEFGDIDFMDGGIEGPIGFWFEHKEYSTSSYANYAVSVNDIESWTGLDLFANLPDSIEETVEANSNWQSFQNF